MKITKNEKLAHTIVDITEMLINNMAGKKTNSTIIEGRKIIHEEHKGMRLSKSFAMQFIDEELVNKIRHIKSYKFICLISAQLFPHCPLWSCLTKPTTQTKLALKELEELKVIIPIRGTNIYYVAPNMISKGNPINVNCALVIYLQKNRKKNSQLSIEDIKPYSKPPNGYEIPYSFNNKIT